MASGMIPRPYPIGNDTTLDPSLTHKCAPKHWDPTMIYRYTLPQQYATQLPTDPRPWTKVCLEYVNSGPAAPAPAVPNGFLVPGAAEFYPPTRYQQAIDQESLLRRLDRPLNNDLLPNTCYPNQYTMPQGSDALQQQTLLPPYEPPKSRMVRELESPAALQRGGQYECSKEAMLCDLAGAPRFWNNHTKLAKYNQREGACGNTLWQYQGGKAPSAENLPRPVQ